MINRAQEIRRTYIPALFCVVALVLQHFATCEWCLAREESPGEDEAVKLLKEARATVFRDERKDDKPFTGIILKGDQVNEENLKLLRVFGNLRSLTIREKLTDKQMVHIGNLGKLKTLDLHACPVTEAGLAELGHLTDLERVMLWNIHLSAKALSRMKTLPKLRDVTIVLDKPWDDGFDIECMTEIRGFPHLQSLVVSCDRFTDDYSRFLGDLVEMDVLSIRSDEITDLGLVTIGELASLSELELACPRITDKGLHQIRRLRKLRRLVIQSKSVTDEGLQALNEILPGLNALVLNRTQITDDTLRALQNVRGLTTLCVDDTRITDRGLDYLVAYKSLSYLSLSNCTFRNFEYCSC